MIVYIYDLKFETKTKFNKQKRNFYYRLKKLDLKKENFPSKSSIVVPDNKEMVMDKFFKDYKNTGNPIVVFKIFTITIEEL